MQIEPSESTRLRMPIPSRKTQSGYIQQGVWRGRIATTDMSVVRRQAKTINAKQCGKTRLKAFKLRTIGAGNHLCQDLVPAHEPMVQTSHDVRHTTAVRVNASWAERRDKLANTDLLISHYQTYFKDCRANSRAGGRVGAQADWPAMSRHSHLRRSPAL